MKKIGIIVNPIAGMGGRVGLKGTDNMLKEAIALGAKPLASSRAVIALKELSKINEPFELLCGEGEMGEYEAKEAMLKPDKIVYSKTSKNETQMQDTINICSDFVKYGVDLILFAGGDGTAKNIMDALTQNVGIEKTAVIGIPAGVKIQSGVFASKPEMAGKMAANFVMGNQKGTKMAEVMDLDEVQYREGKVLSKLYGYMKVPFDNKNLQSKKSGSQPSESASQQSTAWDIVDNMEENILYIIGPGSTTAYVMKTLGLSNTLIGFDVILNKKLVGSDLNEMEIIKLVKTYKAKLVITPIGGQGILLGRGNQQISPEVLAYFAKEDIIAIASKSKLSQLRGRPFLLDTGCKNTDERLSGYIKVITGYKEYVIYKVE